MGNYQHTKQEVSNYIKARSPLIIIGSSERDRVEEMLRSISNELSHEIYYYTETTQVTRICADSNERIDVSGDPLSYIADTFSRKRNVIFCYGDVSNIAEDNVYSREMVNILYAAVKGGSTLILITNDPVYSRIAQFGMITKLDYPDSSERIEQIKTFIQSYKNMYTIDWDETDVLVASTLLSGFSKIQIDNILSNEIVSRNGLLKENIQKLTSQKSKLYGTVSNISLINVPADTSASGLDNLKEWLQEKRKVFFARDEELAYYSISAPKGILLTGVPGCGKSHSAKLIAKQWCLPLFRFDIANIYDKWLGESERKMKDALEFIDNVAPCVLWIDEIEKVLSVSNGENDTGKRILGQFLFWLQESTRRVFLVATANNIDLLPPELFRKGRFSEVFFVDLPQENERKQVIDQYVSQCLHLHLSDEQLSELAALSSGFSYAEIEYVIKEIAQNVFIHSSTSINMQMFRDQFKSTVPIEVSRAESIAAIRKWGQERAVPAYKE